MVIFSLTLISVILSGPTMTSTQLLLGPTRVTIRLVTSTASTVATMVMTPASASISTGPAFKSSMNRSETATAKTPFTAATKTLMNLPPKATDIGTEHYQFGVTPGTGEGPRNEAQNLAFLAFQCQ